MTAHDDVLIPDPELQSPLDVAEAERQRATMSMVRAAIARRDVVLAFQPVVVAGAPARIAFHEGLIRVLDEAGRIIPARDFIAVVETDRAGRELDCIALELGIAELRREPTLRLSINMSARSIGYGPWRDVLDRAIAADPTLAERLILEITESSAMVLPDVVSAFMERYQRAGVAFALDDFGAGFTSFRYLRDFYFDILKIDGEFSVGVASDPDNQVLYDALISIGRHFDMLTVAEGVQSAEDAAYLARAGVDCLQGYRFGVPVTAPPWRESRKRASG